MRRFALVCCLALLILPGCSKGDPTKGAKIGEAVGQVAPDFTLKTTDKKTFTLKEHRGKVVVLHWYATWCKPCLEEWPKVRALVKALGKKKNAVFIGLDVGEPASKAKHYAKKHKLTFTVALDKDQDVYWRYAVPGMPFTTVIDQDGLVAMRTKITDERVAQKIEQLLKDT